MKVIGDSSGFSLVTVVLGFVLLVMAGWGLALVLNGQFLSENRVDRGIKFNQVLASSVFDLQSLGMDNLIAVCTQRGSLPTAVQVQGSCLFQGKLNPSPSGRRHSSRRPAWGCACSAAATAGAPRAWQ